MPKLRLAHLGLAAALLAAPAFAEDNPVDQAIDTNISQQQDIKEGLESGQLTSREAARLEKGESKINRAQSRMLHDDAMSPEEQARLQKMQAGEDKAIDRLDENARLGNPNSASSQRMQADVQRNINQQQRIDQGLESGTLTNREAGAMERGQAHVERREFRAGRDGHVGPAEQNRIQRAENRRSAEIAGAKHNGIGAPGGPEARERIEHRRQELMERRQEMREHRGARGEHHVMRPHRGGGAQ